MAALQPIRALLTLFFAGLSVAPTCGDGDVVGVAVVAGRHVELAEGGEDLLAGRRLDPPLAGEVGGVVVGVARGHDRPVLRRAAVHRVAALDAGGLEGRLLKGVRQRVPGVAARGRVVSGQVRVRAVLTWVSRAGRSSGGAAGTLAPGCSCGCCGTGGCGWWAAPCPGCRRRRGAGRTSRSSPGQSPQSPPRPPRPCWRRGRRGEGWPPGPGDSGTDINILISIASKIFVT